jgi:PPOX class probable F420-dependent enzyme
MIFDPATDGGAHARQRLQSAMAGWLTSVTPEGQPQSMPVWFIWHAGDTGEGDEILVYGDHRAKRNRNLEANPRVSFHLPGTADGGDIVSIEGTARIDPDHVPPGEHAAYLAKYGAWIERSFGGPAQFGAIYSMPIRITPTRGVAFAG